MYTHIYIYIYIQIHLSLSLYIYIYIYITPQGDSSIRLATAALVFRVEGPWQGAPRQSYRCLYRCP